MEISMICLIMAGRLINALVRELCRTSTPKPAPVPQMPIRWNIGCSTFEN